MQKWKRVAREGEFEVERAFEGGAGDIFHPLFRMNPDRYHVWTDHLVIRKDTLVDKTLPDKDALRLEDLERLNKDCLDDPEKYFWIKMDHEMGRGLVAKHEVPASLFVLSFT